MPPSRGIPTAHGLQSPLGPSSEERTLVQDRPQVVAPRGKPAEAKSLAQSAKALAAEWEAELAATDERPRKTRLSYELGRLYEGPLRDLSKAQAFFKGALEHQADHLPSLRGARRIALALGNTRDALPLFDAEARITADSQRKAALFYAKGRVLEDSLGDVDKARQAYHTAAELDRDDPSILKALEQRDRAAEEWSRLERTLEREANAVARDPRHRAALVVERARLLEHRDHRIDGAIELYETALRLDPHASGALQALSRLCHAQKRWRDLIRVLELEAEQSRDAPTRALAFYRIGRLHAERLGNRDEAVVALERAAQESANDPLILEELAAMLESAEGWARLVDVLARLAHVTTDRHEQLALHHRIGNLLDERLQRPAQAREAYESALRIDPTHVPTLQALGRIYETAKAWDALVAMLLAEAEETKEPRRAAAAHARVADVLERHGESLDEAMAHHARALSLFPGYAPSFKALARLYAEAGKHRTLIELYERAVEQAGDAENAITHLFKIGGLYEDALGEHEQAAHTYRRILELDDKRLGALHALQRATERAGRHAELVEALEREADLHHDDARVVDLLERAAEVLDERLSDATGAMRRYKKVLSIDGGYAPALAGLGRIYHRTGRWDDLLELYEQELELDPKGPGAASLLHKMGALAEERIGDEVRAIDCYKRALDVDARHRPSLTALGRRLMARREWNELVRILELELDGLSDPSARARAAFRLGEVHEQHLEMPDRAAAAYETALAAVPGYEPALDALARLRAQQSAWRRLVDQLEEGAAATNDEARAVELLARAGSLWWIALEDPRRAVGCYERALAITPGHLATLLALESLYRKLSRHDALARVYGSLARVLSDPGARIAALRELARITAKEPERATDLRQVQEAVLALSPDDPAALEALESIAIANEDRSLLARIDQRLVAKAGDAKVASSYQTRLAESLEAAGDPGALDAYRAALTSDPENVAAAKGLARAAALMGDAAAVVEASRGEAVVTPDPQRAARLWVKAARISQHELRDGRAALRDYEKALELWPDDADAAAGVTELLLAAGQGARAADRLGRAAGSAKSADRVASLWMEVARLQADLLDNVTGAITSLTRILKEAPNHVPTLRRVAELQGRQGRWSDAAELLAKVVSLAPDRDVLRDAHLALAGIWDEHLDDPGRALVSLQAVLSLDDQHPEALSRLARLSARTGDPDKAAQTLRRLVDAAETAREKAAALVELSQIQTGRGDAEAARQAALQALALEGPGTVSAARHRELIEEPRDWQDHAEALRAWLKTASDPLARRGTRLEIARIFGEDLARPARAVEELEKAVREQPTDVELRRILAMNLRLAGHFPESAAELRPLIADHPARPELWRELAATLHASGDLEGARRALAPLVLMEQATPEERAEQKLYRSRPGRAHPRSLGDGILEAFYPIRRTAALTDLLRLCMPAIAKLYPPDFDAYGISGRDKMSTRSPEPIRVLVDRVSAIFGVPEVAVYLHRARGRSVSVELTDPPALMIPASVTDLAEPHQVFAIARALSDIALGLNAVDKLTPRELEIVLAAASRKVSPGYGAGLTSEETLDDVGKRLHKALPRRNRKLLEEAAHAYVTSEPIDFAHFVEAVTTSANRIALVVCDDLLAAMDVLARSERDLGPLKGQALLRHPMVARLVRFWISPEADALRVRCGLVEPTRSAPHPTGR